MSYNSEQTLAHTIESVLAQTYTNIEYWIIDGASRDRTVEIAESYRSRLEARGIRYHVLSEPDGGIYDAMNKGIRNATGDIIGIINSDDWYEPEAVQTAVETFRKTGCDLMYANIRMYKADGSTFVKRARTRKFQTSRDWNHPTTFVKAECYKNILFDSWASMMTTDFPPDAETGQTDRYRGSGTGEFPHGRRQQSQGSESG